MSQSPQRRKLTSQSPARSGKVRHDNRRSLGLMNTPQGLRGRLPLLAVLLALAALLLVPAIVLAAPGRPGKPSGSSSDGVMTVTWSAAAEATSYQYRYSTNAACLLTGNGCDFGVTDKDWTNHSSSPLTLSDLPTGHTYFSQVRGYDGTDYGEASPASDGIIHNPPKPGELTTVTATAGNAQVTLSWDAPPAGDNVASYDYRQDDGGGSGWGDWQNFTTDTNSHVVTGLSNGTTYSFQVRANNNQGAGPDGDTETATPLGPPAAPDLRADPGDGQVRLYWTDPGDSNIDKYLYRKRVTSAAADAWDPDWTGVP